MSSLQSRQPRDFSVNVDGDERLRETFYKQDETWTGPRLVTLCAVTLALSLALLYYLAERSLG